MLEAGQNAVAGVLGFLAVRVGQPAQHSRQKNVCGEVKPAQVHECDRVERGEEKLVPHLYLKVGYIASRIPELLTGFVSRIVKNFIGQCRILSLLK